MTDADIRAIAGAVAVQGEQMQRIMGEADVLTMAVLALVRSHPDPAGFAAEFRRFWLQNGSQHSHAELGEPALGSISEMLSMLEEACVSPLGVRPQRDATK